MLLSLGTVATRSSTRTSMSAYTDKLKGVPIKYKWDKNNYYTCIPQSQNHKSPQGWWNVVWEEDGSRSVVNLTERAFRVGNWKFKYKQPRAKRSSKKASQGTAKKNKSLHQLWNSPSMRLTGSSGSKRTESIWHPLDWTLPEMKLAIAPTRPKNTRLGSARNAVRSLRQYHGRDGESPVVYAVAKQSQRWTLTDGTLRQIAKTI